jgi:hypothetical protein
MTAKLNQFAQGFRIPWGQDLNNVVDAVNNVTGNGTAGAVAATTLTTTGNISTVQNAKTVTNSFQTLTAAGATQGDATAITGSKAIITVALTASTKGVKLPTAATGLEVLIANAATFGVKVYPATNGKLGASATNAAIVLAINKANRYIAVNTTRWILQVGG